MDCKKEKKKCAYSGCSVYFEEVYDGQVYGPECERKALRQKLLTKPSTIKTYTNEIVVNLSRQKKKIYFRKISDIKSEISRLRNNYYLSFSGKYQNLDNDLQKVLNGFREACDQFSQLLYDKYEGDSYDVTLYFNTNQSHNNGMENHCFNKDCIEIWDRVKSQINLNKVQSIFDIQNKGKHNLPNSVSLHVGTSVVIGEVKVKNKYGGEIFMKDCVIKNSIMMINQDYDWQDLVLSAIGCVIQPIPNRDDIIEFKSKDIKGLLVGITKDPLNKKSFIKVLNPKDQTLYDVEDIIKEIESILIILEAEVRNL